MKKLQELIEDRKKLIEEMRGMLFTDKGEKRDNLSTEETAKYQSMVQRSKELGDMIEAEMRQVAQDEELRRIHVEPEGAEKGHEFRELRQAMSEKRAVTLNGAGAISVLSELFKVLQAKTPVLERVRYFRGANANTNIPIWNPTIATPNNYAEGAGNVAWDAQGQLGIRQLTPVAYASVLPVSAEAVKMGAINIESELNSIFADAFAQAFHAGVLQGDGLGRNMLGLFPAIPVANRIPCGAAGAPLVADLVTLALGMKDRTDNSVIIMNPSIYSSILADVTVGVADLYKEELIRSKTIEGVPVLLTSGAPAATAAGSIVAVAGELNQYAIAMASEITIEPKKIVGDTNTYFEATVFANGRPIIPENFFGLVTI